MNKTIDPTQPSLYFSTYSKPKLLQSQYMYQTTNKDLGQN